MFWPVSGSESQRAGETSWKWPWATLGVMCLLLLAFVWSASTSPGSERAIKAAEGRVLCHYLRYDYLHIEAEHLAILPSVIQRHHEKVQEVVSEYQRDPTARRQAQTWLQDGEWDSGVGAGDGKSVDCLGKAIAQGQLGKHPKRRVFVALAKLEESELARVRSSLKGLLSNLVEVRHSHPKLGWGFETSKRRLMTVFTSFWISGGWFAFLWTMLALWIFGQLLERQIGWKWLIYFVSGGLFSNFVLAFWGSKNAILLLGGGGAIAVCVGAWMIFEGLSSLRVDYAVPWTSVSGSLPVPAVGLLGGWVLFEFLDILVISKYPMKVFLTHMIGFGLSAGITYVLKEQNVFLEIEGDSPVQKARPEPRKHLTTLAPRPRVQLEADDDELGKRAKEAYERGDFKKAVGLYREAISPGRTPLWVFEGLLTACEKAEMTARAEEYVRAIRMSAEGDFPEKVKAFYHQFILAHGPSPLSGRDRLQLVNALKRSGMLQEASLQADRILDKGVSNPFYMKALLLKAESMLELGKNAEKTLQLYEEADGLLINFPEFQDAVRRGKQQAESQVDAMFGAGALGSFLEGAEGEEGDELGGEVVAGSLGDFMNKAGVGLEIDDKMLSELELYDALAQEMMEPETDPGSSWSELPSLVLKRDQLSGDEVDDGPTSMFAPAESKGGRSSLSMFAPDKGSSLKLPASESEDKGKFEVSGDLFSMEEEEEEDFQLMIPSVSPLGASLEASLEMEEEEDQNILGSLDDLDGGFLPGFLKEAGGRQGGTSGNTREHPKAGMVDPAVLIEDSGGSEKAGGDWGDWEASLPMEGDEGEVIMEEASIDPEDSGAHPWESSVSVPLPVVQIEGGPVNVSPSAASSLLGGLDLSRPLGLGGASEPQILELSQPLLLDGVVEEEEAVVLGGVLELTEELNEKEGAPKKAPFDVVDWDSDEDW